MPTMIYPGVYLPSVVQTPIFAQSRAKKYIDMYTDQRYANWQTSLDAATAEYKADVDIYTAQAKALADSIRNAEKTLADARNDADKLKSTMLSTDEKQQTFNASAAQRAAQFNAGAANSAMRSAEYNKTRSAFPQGTDMNEVAAIASLGAEAGRTNSSQLFKPVDDYVQRQISVGATPSPAMVAELDKQVVRNAIAKGYINPEDPYKNIRSDDPNYDRMASAFDRNMAEKNQAVTTDGQYQGVSGSGVSFKGTQAERKAELAKKDEEIKSLEEQLATLKTRQSLATAPKGDLIGRARDIYATKFESLPAHEKQVAVDNLNTIMTAFINRRMLALDDTSTSSDKADARSQGIADAISYIKTGEVPEIKKATKAPSEPPVAPAKGNVVDITLPGDDEYTYRYNRETDEFEVVSGPANVGKTYGKGTDAYTVLSTKGIEKVEKKEEKKEETAPVDINEGIPSPDAFDLGEEEIITEPAPALTTEQKRAAQRKLMGIDEGLNAALAMYPNSSDKPVTTKEPEAPYTPGTTERARARQFVLNQMGVSGPLIDALEQFPSDDNQAKVDAIVEGVDLAKKPKKLDRLVNNTDWGKFASDLVLTNSKSTKPRSTEELRQEILRQYKDDPNVANRAVKLMYALKLVNGSSAP